MKALIFIKRYIKYLLVAKNKHRAQSPFLYEFITKVLNGNSDDENCKIIENLRKELCQLNQIIEITDFGAGSHVNNAKKRKVKDVAKNSSKNSKFGKYREFRDSSNFPCLSLESKLFSSFLTKNSKPRK